MRITMRSSSESISYWVLAAPVQERSRAAVTCVRAEQTTPRRQPQGWHREQPTNAGSGELTLDRTCGASGGALRLMKRA